MYLQINSQTPGFLGILNIFFSPTQVLLQSHLHTPCCSKKCAIVRIPLLPLLCWSQPSSSICKRKHELPKSTALKMPVVIIATRHSSMVPRTLLLLSFPLSLPFILFLTPRANAASNPGFPYKISI